MIALLVLFPWLIVYYNPICKIRYNSLCLFFYKTLPRVRPKTGITQWYHYFFSKEKFIRFRFLKSYIRSHAHVCVRDIIKAGKRSELLPNASLPLPFFGLQPWIMCLWLPYPTRNYFLYILIFWRCVIWLWKYKKK